MLDDDAVSLFPLKTVLYPGGVLPLRIFEPRYLDMVGRCLRNDERFGVLSIAEGSESGPARTVTIGTLAEIVDWNREADGLLGITAVGRDRFEATDIAVREDRSYAGSIRILAAEPRLELPPEYRDLARILKRVLPTMGGAYAHVVEAYDDATWVGYRLAEILPLSLEDKQACLEMEDALARLDKLRSTFN
jgi:uncharacterized protein